MTALRPGLLLVEGTRRYEVLAVQEQTVAYRDWYASPAGPVSYERLGSRIMFELGLERGEITEYVKPKKGGER
jgi:hypothetical protein